MFPEAILNELRSNGDPIYGTYVKAVPKLKNPRKAVYEWTQMRAGGTVVEMETCEETDWVRSDPNLRKCSWLSAVDKDFDVESGIKTD